jgi:23S rRNA pseudouridine2605 synthase
MKKSMNRNPILKKMKVRLNKYLAECGAASRRKAEELITEGRITVNKTVVRELAFSIDPEADSITIDGEKVKPIKKIYFLLNKPKGFITSTSDEKGRKTVVELIDTKQKIFPVGRLDYNTTGVLLLTNDGDFANFLTHPGYKIKREYKVTLNRELDESDRLKFLNGLKLEGRKGKFESIKYLHKGKGNKLLITTVEGRNHFVKNMFALLGYFVDELERVDYAGITVKGIPHGGYRKLSYEEIKNIYRFNSVK